MGAGNIMPIIGNHVSWLTATSEMGWVWDVLGFCGFFSISYDQNNQDILVWILNFCCSDFNINWFNDLKVFEKIEIGNVPNPYYKYTSDDGRTSGHPKGDFKDHKSICLSLSLSDIELAGADLQKLDLRFGLVGSIS